VLGIVLAVLMARVFRSTILRGPDTPFVMELPPYRLPTLRGVAIHTWDRVWQFLKKAGTVILGVSIIMWVLMTFPQLPDERKAEFDQQRAAAKQQVAQHVVDQNLTEEKGNRLVQKMFAKIDGREGETGLKYSLAGRISATLEPVARLSGFPWQTTIAMLGGFAAKEVFVSTMSTAYSMGDVDPEEATSLSEQLRNDPAYTGPAVYSIILFLLLYTPCMVTVVAIAKESNWKWAVFSSLGALVFAYILSVAVFQIGTALSA
ncbi:MAG: ferrous iron transporter B, partial [Desulfuromonadales bacterium]|nr:ferrous iron transporter B [Desulfuromonadales bacterium]